MITKFIKKGFRKITQEELDEILEKHRLYLKDWNEKNKADLSYTDFRNISLKWKNLEKVNLVGSNLSEIWSLQERITYSDNILYLLDWTDFSKANLTDTNVKWLNFRLADVNGAVFIWSNYKSNQFSEQQLNLIIETEEWLQKKIWELEQKISIKDKAIKNIWDKRTEELKEWFEILKQNYANEERKWLVISITIFLVLITSAFLPILFAIWLKWAEKIVIYFILAIFAIIYAFLWAEEWKNNKNEDWFEKIINNNKTARIILSIVTFIWLVILIQYAIWNTNMNLPFDYTRLIPFLPFEIISLTFLYFCIYQFSKAKNLRIEQQNKIAVVSWYQALIAQEELTWKEVRLSYFLPNISDVLFCKVNEKNDNNLPIDKVVEVAKLIKVINGK